MNELQIITNSFTPAKVEFNYEQIETQLDAMLRKYDGLIFTEETVTDCKKTIAELRKGQKSLDDFRKETKKRLTESVTEFENQCKKLYGKFDTVIAPLAKQADEFEEARREEKRNEIQVIIEDIVRNYEIDEKYADTLTIEPSWLNKTSAITIITQEIITKAKHLKTQQDKDLAHKQLIENKIELVNMQYRLELSAVNYVRLLEYKDLNDVLEIINSDVEKFTTEEVKPASKPRVQVPAPKPKVPTATERFTEIYEITGTEEELDELEDFLKEKGYDWKFKEEE